MLWKDYRQHKARWWRRNRNVQISFFSVYLLAAVFAAVVRSGAPLAVLTAVALYASGTALVRCKSFYARATAGYDRAVLIALPVSDTDYVRHESRTFFRSWLGAFVIFGLAYGVYAAVYGDFWRDLAPVLAASILQTLVSLSLGTAVVAIRPKWAGTSVIVPFYGLMVLSSVIRLPEVASRFLWSAVLVTPAGWAAHGFAGLVGSANGSERSWLVPAFLASAMLPLTWRALRSKLLSAIDSPDYAFDKVFVPASEDAGDEGNTSAAQPINEWELVSVEDRGHRDSKSIVGTRLGWIERLVARFLRDREKVVAEFMLANDVRTRSKNWRSASIISLAGIALTLAMPSVPSWLLFLPMIVAGFMSAPILGGSWVGFKGPFTSGFWLPAYSVFPLSYTEISRVMLKTNYVRIFTWAPLAIAYSLALSHRLGYSFAHGARIGADVICIVLALQPVIIAGRFSAGTNDTRQINWQTVSFLVLALALLVTILAAVFTTFIAATVLVQGCAVVVLFVTGFVGWIAYKLLFERGRIDTLSRPGGQ
ncbi:MAG TPA: hypothetical protein VE866_16070 [Candidatus Binatia bacterium]|nr:hypothetical protein [Candidatus Binatia bacterium]